MFQYNFNKFYNEYLIKFSSKKNINFYNENFINFFFIFKNIIIIRNFYIIIYINIIYFFFLNI